MSAVLFIIGLLIFSMGSFGLYSGLYVGKGSNGELNASGQFAANVREALSRYLADPKTVLVLAGAALAAAGAAFVVWGCIRAKREEKTRASIDVHVLSVLAMLLAMTVMLDRFPGLSIKSAGWNIGFTFVPPMIAAVLLGPLEAALVYGLADLIGATLFPFGTYHPGFTIIAALMGFIMGVFLNKRPFAFAKSKFEWKKIRFFPNIIVPVLINCLILGLVVNTVWVSQLYGKKTYIGWFLYRLVEYVILVPVQLAAAPAVLKLCDTLKKTGSFNPPRSSARSRIKAISQSGSILGLDRVKELLKLMGDPEEGLKTVHVAGTNGKGSFSAQLASVLKEAGYKVGAFNSPALTGPADSFRINGKRIDERMLEKQLSSIKRCSAKMEDKPTEFEVLTAAAFGLFKKEKCDIAVVECGLGGSGDATNVIRKPLLSVITNVQLDHTDRLGKTLPEIAEKKAGIIKASRPVLWGGGEGEAFEVVKKRAAECSSKLVCTDIGRLKVISETIDGTEIEFSGFGRLRLGLLGAYQPENAANVLTAVELLREQGLDISDEAVKRGLENAVWPARFELISKEPVVIFDGSHNPDGVALAAESIRKLFPGKKAVLLMGVMADKDYKKYP
ncbi:MAG: folate family ECF transporter S component, partial [Clostridia bacterium]|nr:folate family ECF transporter S component [Clostridia bacterium]